MIQLPENEKTAYLGPIGTFSYFTALFSLNKPDLQAFNNFKALFEAVESGLCPIGLIPLENSLHGTIGQNFDLFIQHNNLHIQGEVYARISNSLMSKEVKKEDIHTIYSHAQPLGQCAEWIHTNFPHAKLIPTNSTAQAGELASNNVYSAAIGHAKLAEIYNLNVLFNEIEDDKDNWTRFVAITSPNYPIYIKKENYTESREWKSTFIFTVQDKAGSLVAILSILDKYQVNMRKLESRPLRGNNTGSGDWKYAFFTDVECDITQEEHAKMLEELEKKCASIKILGSYPQGKSLKS